MSLERHQYLKESKSLVEYANNDVMRKIDEQSFGAALKPRSCEELICYPQVRCGKIDRKTEAGTGAYKRKENW